MLPRNASTARLTTSMPTPRPETLVTWLAVEKPGEKNQMNSSRSLISASAPMSPCAIRPPANRRAVEPLPSSRISMSTLAPACAAESQMRPLFALAGGLPHLRRFDAVIDAVADQVHQRIAEPFDDGLVQFGFGPFGNQLDLFAEFFGQIAHQAAEAAEGGADREHADPQHLIAQRPGQPFDFFADRLQHRRCCGWRNAG